jgi:hypothetical protein
MQPNNQQLRDALDYIVDRYACDDVGEQIRQIKNLAQKYPHSISLVYEAIPNKPGTFSFNCLSLAKSLDAHRINNLLMCPSTTLV